MRLWVDFNKSGRVGIPLTTRGSLANIQRVGLVLAEGTRVRLYQEDVDIQGRRGELVADGVLRLVEDHWEAELVTDVAFVSSDCDRVFPT
jgi:hypothetical protein